MSTPLRLRQLFLLSFGLVLALGMSACRDAGLINPPTPQDSCCGRVNVFVSYSRTTAPLAGVQVALRQGTSGAQTVVKTATTGQDGMARFTGVCPGAYNLRMTKDGMAVVERGDVLITGCDSVNVYAAMLPAGGGDSCCQGSVMVIPTDANGAPIVGASVRLTSPNGTVRDGQSTTTGITFSALCQGVYQLRIAKDGFQVDETAITVDCDRELAMRRMLRANSGGDSCCHGRITVVPKDSATGVRIDGALVKLWKGNQLLRTVTVQGAAVVFDGLCPDVYQLSISATGYRGSEFNLQMSCNSSVERAVMLARNNEDCCNSIVSVAVTDGATQRRLPYVTVILRSTAGVTRTATTNAEGVARFEGVCKGAWVAVIEARGYNRFESLQTAIGCGQTTTINAVLRPVQDCCTNTAVIRVMNSRTRAAVAGASVRLTTPDGAVIYQGTTSSLGTVRDSMLCPGDLLVRVSKDGFQVAETRISVVCGKVTETTVLLEPAAVDTCCSAVFHYRAVTSNAAGAVVGVSGASYIVTRNNVAIARGTTDANGYMNVQGICNLSSYVIVFEKQGLQRAALEVQVPTCTVYEGVVRM